MANRPMYGKGIVLTTGFDLGAKTPLDSRSIVNTIAERDAHVSGNRAYVGMKVYVLEEQKEYRYTGSGWKELDVIDLSVLATKDDIANINLDLSTNYATLTYVNEQISTHDHEVISDDEIIQEINKD